MQGSKSTGVPHRNRRRQSGLDASIFSSHSIPEKTHAAVRLTHKSAFALTFAALGPAAPAAVAQAQDLFVSSFSNTLSRFAGTGPGTFSTTPTTLSGAGTAEGLAFDTSGDLFVANFGSFNVINSGSITEFAAGTTPGTFAAGTIVQTGLTTAGFLTFGPPAVPEASTTVSLGLLLALGGIVVAARRKKMSGKAA